MSEFKITCPVSRKVVSTGVQVVENLLADPVALMAARMKCPACGKDHIWTMKGALIADEAAS